MMGPVFERPTDLEPVVDFYRRSAEAFKMNHSNDPMTSEFLLSDCTAHLERALEITRTTDVTFLELGCGVGLNPVIAKKLGVTSSYGIDINPRLIEEAESNLARVVEEGLLPEQNLPVYLWGNFFTRGQLAVIRKEVSDRTYKHLVLENPYADSDVYERFGIGFDAIDIFYMYPWHGKDVDFFERFFQEHARDGAVLLLRNGRMKRK
ncbi:MAG: 50S ribosomal protein L11 methyltransferase [bacterium]